MALQAHLHLLRSPSLSHKYLARGHTSGHTQAKGASLKDDNDGSSSTVPSASASVQPVCSVLPEAPDPNPNP